MSSMGVSPNDKNQQNKPYSWANLCFLRECEPNYRGLLIFEGKYSEKILKLRMLYPEQ